MPTVCRLRMGMFIYVWVLSGSKSEEPHKLLLIGATATALARVVVIYIYNSGRKYKERLVLILRTKRSLYFRPEWQHTLDAESTKKYNVTPSTCPRGDIGTARTKRQEYCHRRVSVVLKP